MTIAASRVFPSSVGAASVAHYVRAILDRALESSEAFTRTAQVVLPGVRVEVRSCGGPLLDAVEENLLHQPDEASLPDVEPMRVLIAHPAMPGIPEPARWAHEIYSPHRVAETLAAAGLRGSYYGDLHHWHVYDPSERVALQLMSGPDAYPPWEPGAPLRPFLHWHYAERGMRLAHCGTLGANGVGVLFAGAGGSGKSATVIAGLLHGLESVGDDYVLLRQEREVCAYPLFSTLRQDPEGFERLGLSGFVPRERPLNWQGKHQFSMAEIRSLPCPRHLEIRAILVPQITGGTRSRFVPLDRGEAMRSLAMSSISQMPGEREGGFRFFGSAIRRLPCLRLELGANSAEIADTVRAFVEREGHAA